MTVEQKDTSRAAKLEMPRFLQGAKIYKLN